MIGADQEQGELTRLAVGVEPAAEGGPLATDDGAELILGEAERPSGFDQGLGEHQPGVGAGAIIDRPALRAAAAECVGVPVEWHPSDLVLFAGYATYSPMGRDLQQKTPDCPGTEAEDAMERAAQGVARPRKSFDLTGTRTKKGAEAPFSGVRPDCPAGDLVPRRGLEPPRAFAH